MSCISERHLKTGGDPRTLADYATLRDEMNKLTHPARPDVNWLQVEKLCLSLFASNGIELQTAAWYTLARVQLAGLYGLNEGLSILEALITHQWEALWPQPIHVRMDILGGLSKRLQRMMRTLPLRYADLSLLYQAEQHLTRVDDVLQRLELKHQGPLDALRNLIHSAAVRLESCERTADGADVQPATAETYASARLAPPNEEGEETKKAPWIYVAQPERIPHVDVVMAWPVPTKPWKSFVGGMFTMLLSGSLLTWGYWALHDHPEQDALMASVSPLPITLTAAQLQTLHEQPLSANTVITHTRLQLARLRRLPPDWNIRYGHQLVEQAQTLLPEQMKPLAQQWQQQLNASVLPAEQLNGWHQGMVQLQQLTHRLNGLDESHGKYMTVSELKSAVFSLQQAFSRAVPAEEQLRQLALVPQGQPLPAAQQSQTEWHLKQLIARYALLQRHEPE